MAQLMVELDAEINPGTIIHYIQTGALTAARPATRDQRRRPPR